MNENEIQWNRRNRPSKADGGHSLIRTGWLPPSYPGGVGRQYAECQCGKTLSLQSLSAFNVGPIFNYLERHRRNEGVA